MTILVIGDSNTFGYELPDLPNCDTDWFGNEYFDINQRKKIQLSPSKLAWPALLGRLRGEPVDNLSLIGGSNDRIFRLAVSTLIKQKYDLVICAWTSLPRFDLKFQGKELAFTSNTPGLLKNLPWLNDYLNHHYDEYHMFEKTLNQILTLQNHFKLIDQKFLFLDSMKIWFFPKVGMLIRTYEELIDKKYYPTFWQDDLMDWTKQFSTMPKGHMSVEAHQAVANRLQQYLLEIGL
jgi:hypothetical protein